MVTVVDDLLTSRGITTAPTPAATGSGAVAGAVAAPATAPAAPSVAPDSAVGQAIDMNSKINAAATDQVSSDPMMKPLFDAIGRQRQDIDQARIQIDEKAAKLAALDAQPLPAHIPIPRMKPLPAVPTLEDVAHQASLRSRSAVTYHLSALEAAGWVEVGPSGRGLRLTTSGLKLAKSSY